MSSVRAEALAPNDQWPRFAPSPSVRELSFGLGVSATLAGLLERRGHRDLEATRRFLNPRLAELTSPDAMADRGAAAERMARAIRSGERIAVFGDYDCDGMTSAAIMTEVIGALGGEAVTFIASRFEGGYGVSSAAVDKILASGAGLLVTCDCGSSDHVSLARVKNAGVDTVVIDHHLVPDEPLPALAFLNPHRPECGFPYKGLASCGLALSIAAALRSALGKALDLRRWLDLVAIGTIADVAPLDGDNRALVRAGLRALGEARRPGIRALLELAKLGAEAPITAEDIAFRIAPRLNAPGRLGAPDIAVKLLLAKTLDEAQGFAAEIEQCSSERRLLQEQMIEQALAEIEREGYADRPAIVVGREGWNHGIVGIVAGRLADKFEKPVIAVGFTDGHGRASVRGPAGSRLFDALAESKDVLVRFGGHQAAAGCELMLPQLDALRARFEAACAARPPQPKKSANEAAELTWLAPGDQPARVLEDLYLLEPCGPGNESPALAFEACVLSARQVQGGHLKLELELDGGVRLGAFGVGMGEQAQGLTGRVAVCGKLRPDRYRGGNAIELKLEKILE
ncbi:MAG TPA: single-stranded-DNA-specific exonuclease RecJ [Polyangiaceae bacterium]|nr:single-stranded-DNA-specific exonuclease RecJ [Polyangiaceae bacterium]